MEPTLSWASLMRVSSKGLGLKSGVGFRCQSASSWIFKLGFQANFRVLNLALKPGLGFPVRLLS